MFEGLANKIQGKPVAPVASPKMKLPPKKTGALFSGLADKIRAKESAPVVPPATVAPMRPPINIQNPLKVAGPVAPVAPAPVMGPVLPSKPAAPAPIARGPRIADVAPPRPVVDIRNPLKIAPPPKPVDTITAPPPKWIDKPGFLPTAARTVRDTFKDTVQRGVDLTEAIVPTGQYDEERKGYYAPEVTPGQRASAMISAGTGAVNLAFAPLSGLFAGAEDIQLAKPDEAPGMFELPKAAVKYTAKGLNKAMHFIGEKGSDLTGKGLELLPQTEGVKSVTPALKEVGGLLAVLLVGKVAHETVKLPKTIEEYKGRVATTNDIVTSAQKILDLPVEKDALGRVRRTSPEAVNAKYREIAHEVHPDRGGSAQEFQVVAKAREILNDHASLSAAEFAKKYDAPLAEVQKTIQQLPSGEKGAPTFEPPKSSFEGLAERLKAQEASKTTAIAPKMAPEAVSPSFEALKVAPTIPTAPPVIPEVTARVPSALPEVPKYELPKVKGVPVERVTFKAENPIHDRVMTELLGAERGRRIAVQNDNTAGMTFSRQASTFPDWIPRELRRKPLLNAVADHVYNGTMPTKAAEARLYRVVAEEMKAQEAVLNDKQFIQQQRDNLFDPFATAEENAAKLAKFDTEYAKLKSGDVGRADTRGSSVQGVDQPVVLRDKIFPATEPAPRAEVAPRSMFGEGKSKIGKSIEAKAIEQNLASSFSDTAGYQKINLKDQATRAADLLNTNLESAKRMLAGEEALPEGLRAESLILALEEYALKNKDAQLALDIANSPLTSETSVHAQAMRIMAERNPDSATAAIQRLKKIKEKAAEKLSATKSSVVKEIKKAVESTKKAKATKETWSSFIDSITC